jgi:hypothetical protein
MRAFDGVAIGDNHIAWSLRNIVNHGSLLAMTSAQVGHVAKLGIVYSDNTYEAVSFPEIDPQWQGEAVQEKTDSIIQSLSAMQIVGADFVETLTMQAEQAKDQVQVLYYELLAHLNERN